MLKAQRPWSSPTWGRGLKLSGEQLGVRHVPVVPYMGTWIETADGNGEDARTARRPLHGDVD